MMAGEAISRILWAHGEAKCPTCGLPLDPTPDGRDHVKMIHVVGETSAREVIGDHSRCGSAFHFVFLDLPKDSDTVT